jgi:hypothetical protein
MSLDETGHPGILHARRPAMGTFRVDALVDPGVSYTVAPRAILAAMSVEAIAR